MSHSVNVASVIKFYWLIFYSNGSNRTKRGARESGPGSRIQQFGSILEPQIRFRAARARNLRYRAQAVPCILDKIVDTNGPVGSYLRFRFSGGDALRVRIIRMKFVLFVLCTFEGQSTKYKKYNGSYPEAPKWIFDFCNFIMKDVLGFIRNPSPSSCQSKYQFLQVIVRLPTKWISALKMVQNNYLIVVNVNKRLLYHKLTDWN